MRVADAEVAALRAALSGDSETFDRLADASDRDYGDGFGILMATAFVAAARHRFPGEWSVSDLITFVGRARAHDQGERADINASAAEQMLLTALTNQLVPMRGKFDQIAKGYTQAAILAELVSDLDGQQLDAFLTEARVRANRWLAEHALPVARDGP
jgi:hypothetical protein